MSGPEAQKPDDQLLAEFLAEQGAVRETYRAMAQEQAPAHLDAAILQAAQAAAHPAPRALRRRWQTPMAAAAVMVLSFGVLLQVQRDPIVQKELMEPPAAPVARQMMQDDVKTDALAEVAPVSVQANAEQKQESVAVEKLKSLPLTEKSRSAAIEVAPPAPPPPAMAMADAPLPVVAASPAPEAAAMGAMARESATDQQRLEATAAPMAKASRAPVTSMLMSPRDSSKIAVASAIERWAQSCEADALDLDEQRQWRGLALHSWARQGGDAFFQTALLFAPEVTGEAIAASLGALAAKATLTTSACVGPVMRELRQLSAGWALVCECRLYAE